MSLFSGPESALASLIPRKLRVKIEAGISIFDKNSAVRIRCSAVQLARGFLMILERHRSHHRRDPAWTRQERAVA
jgi:uncharacterized membrane protein YozB (DUF420 family)